jgi:hypothetical protein
MKTLLLLTLSLALFSLTTEPAAARPQKKMKAFGSERELQRFLRKVAAKQRRSAARKRAAMGSGSTETVMVSASVDEAESITNTQHPGVDEGGIVKLHGDHLVILRRGRLFTIAIGDNALTPISAIDAFGPDIDPNGSWYDEMLVAGDTIVVIGYSYDRGGTEVGLFDINAQGQLSYRSTYHLRANDYYSSRNYASRLIGSKLIFYSPLHFYAGDEDEDPFQSLPGLRKWRKGASGNGFQRIVSARHVYHPQAEFDVDDGITFHTVTICELANRGFACDATSVIGPPGNVFYVSPDSVYVWATPWSESEKPPQSLLFRMPLDGSGPGALRVFGGPVDQFSFLQSEDHHLNVLVRSQSKGDGMWAAEVAEGDVALMRIPLISFSDGSQTTPASSYRRLPKPEGYYFQNRFVGAYLIYGTGTGWGIPEITSKQNELYLMDWARGNLHRLPLAHGVDRIEQMGAAAIVIGTNGKDLNFTSIRLNNEPEIISTYTSVDASQGETRSHGFFYKPDGDNSGTIGLPISLPSRPAHWQLFESSAALLFLRNDDLRLNTLGELTAQSEKAVDDRCRASCVDWYGNARPLFIRGRVFGLLGYELVEGRLENGRITEVRRTSFAPQVIQP